MSKSYILLIIRYNSPFSPSKVTAQQSNLRIKTMKKRLNGHKNRLAHSGVLAYCPLLVSPHYHNEFVSFLSVDRVLIYYTLVGQEHSLRYLLGLPYRQEHLPLQILPFYRFSFRTKRY